ncbi:MAG TPA: TetR/AcrR family transcriptional regulator [Acidimicrobiales bacterium]|jgi:AcrR family transcriptional regulator|nr:TetR/AcrR family transcriptional regulator [Acidimicrobiales bacterium]
MAISNEAIRPVGRPRATPGYSSEDVAEEILMAAAELFAENGFTTTSTRAIADAVGLRQASLFHYFARKEDILIELLDRTVRPTLDVVHRLKLEKHAPELALWHLIRVDTANLCEPQNLGALQLLPEARGDQFEFFWRRRNQLFRVYARLIARGYDAGTFREADPRMSAEVVFGLVESVITASHSFRQRSTTPVVIADAALRICGVPPGRARAVARAARLLEAR